MALKIPCLVNPDFNSSYRPRGRARKIEALADGATEPKASSTVLQSDNLEDLEMSEFESLNFLDAAEEGGAGGTSALPGGALPDGGNRDSNGETPNTKGIDDVTSEDSPAPPPGAAPLRPGEAWVRLDQILIHPHRRDWVQRQSAEDQAAMVSSLRARGNDIAVILDEADDSMVDGHSRYGGMREAGHAAIRAVRQRFQSQDEILALVLDTEVGRRRLLGLSRYLLYRRHQSYFDSRAANIKAGGTASIGQKLKTRDCLAIALGMGPQAGRTFATYDRLAKQAPDLIQRLRDGVIGLREAERTVQGLKSPKKRDGGKVPPQEPQTDSHNVLATQGSHANSGKIGSPLEPADGDGDEDKDTDDAPDSEDEALALAEAIERFREGPRLRDQGNASEVSRTSLRRLGAAAEALALDIAALLGGDRGDDEDLADDDELTRLQSAFSETGL